MRIDRITSSGQSGVEQAALDAAIQSGLAYSGWCAIGETADDQPGAPCLQASYPKLRETPSRTRSQRIQWNVRDSDATLILHTSRGIGYSTSTILTQQQAQHECKPAIVLDISDYESLDMVIGWLSTINGNISLHIAGPRETEAGGIYSASLYFIEDLLSIYSTTRTTRNP